MDENSAAGCGFLAGLLMAGVIFFIVLFIPALEKIKSVKDEAIQHGYAHYDQKTAEWKWNEQKPEEEKK
jgi:hypothetical protein